MSMQLTSSTSNLIRLIFLLQKPPPTSFGSNLRILSPPAAQCSLSGQSRWRSIQNRQFAKLKLIMTMETKIAKLCHLPTPSKSLTSSTRTLSVIALRSRWLVSKIQWTTKEAMALVWKRAPTKIATSWLAWLATQIWCRRLIANIRAARAKPPTVNGVRAAGWIA